MTRTNFLILSALSLGILFPGIFRGQNIVSLDDAVSQAMEHNHGIQIARNNTAIADNNARPGNAGLLPRVAASGAYNYSNNNTQLQFAGNIPDVEQNGAESTTLNGSIGLSYTLFDGMGNVYNFRKLQSGSRLAEVQERISIENTLIQVIAKYYEVGRLQEALNLSRKNLEVSTNRLERAEARNEFGGANALQVLNAQVDRNADSINVLSSIRTLENAKRELNFLMGKTSGITYEVETSVTLNRGLDEEELVGTARQNNANVLLSEQNRLISEWDLKIARAARFPVVGLTGSYGYTNNQNDASIILQSTNVGFSGGVSVNFNLFDGRRTTTRIENARMNIQNFETQKEQALLAIDRDIRNAYANFQHNIRVLELEGQNVETAEANFNRTKEQFDAGQVNSTQFREAQLNLAAAQNRLINARFNAKLSEMELQRLSGSLIRSE